MDLPRSGVARTLLVTLTAAIGLAALKLNAPFWLGVLLPVVAWWMLAALNGAFRGPSRVFWAGFFATAVASLLVSFGPWSDREARANLVDWNVDRVRLRERIWPVTYFLAKSMPLIEPRHQGTIMLGNRAENPTDDPSKAIAWASYSVRDDRYVPFRGSDRHRETSRQVRSIVETFPSPPNLPKIDGASVILVFVGDYQDSGHLLAALVLAVIGGAVACSGNLLLRRRSTSVRKKVSTPGSDGNGSDLRRFELETRISVIARGNAPSSG